MKIWRDGGGSEGFWVTVKGNDYKQIIQVVKNAFLNVCPYGTWVHVVTTYR